MVIRRWMAVGVVGMGFALPTVAEPPERALSLDEVLSFAEENAPAIAVAEGRVAFVEADVVAAAPWLPAYPDLDVGGGGRVGGGQDGADVSIGLSQQLELFGEPGLRKAAAERGVDVARLEVARARFLVHQTVHRAFFAALVADADVAAADAAVVFAARVVEVAEARVKAGDANSLTVRLARTAATRAKEQALTAREGQRASRLALGREAGFADAIAIQPRGALSAPAALPTQAALTSLALDHQPALAALQATVAAEQAQHALADREALPKPTVGIGYSVEGLAPSSNQTQHIVGATVSVPLPFFRGNDAERARAVARERLAQAELEAERRRLAGHVAEAWTRAEAARARVLLFTEELLPGSDEMLGQLEKAFALGELDLTEVMVGREQLLAARRESLAAWRGWFEALAALEAEVGAELPSSSSPTPSSSSSSSFPSPPSNP